MQLLRFQLHRAMIFATTPLQEKLCVLTGNFSPRRMHGDCMVCAWWAVNRGKMMLWSVCGWSWGHDVTDCATRRSEEQTSKKWHKNHSQQPRIGRGGGGGGGGRKSTKLVNSLLSGPSLIKFSTLSAPTKVVIVVVENSIRNDDFLKKLKNALGYGLETFWKFKWTNFQNSIYFSTASVHPWLP